METGSHERNELVRARLDVSETGVGVLNTLVHRIFLFFFSGSLSFFFLLFKVRIFMLEMKMGH